MGHDWSVFGTRNGTHSVISAKPGFVHLRFIVDKHNLNRQGSLNGGCIASLIDSAGSLAVSSHGLYFTGVSTDMSQTFVKPIPYDQPVEIYATAASLGRTMAFTRVEFCDSSHTKYIANSQGQEVCKFSSLQMSAHMTRQGNVKFSEDGESTL
ncbi:hypothetical protein E3P92_02351 [Wallemia ichthyophaga]|uniref:Thioesterase domain-containing protein n=1 Tax=Wallemia ichthyophaga TaxID=245174 RepID=A0A4T0IQ24_WALIC|nr:hypothetical protein E3P97_02293 [Wallemia ichthyophaga]TIB11691.1 hypothetical protein E3P90_02308 [Wallemia ichthyophaga]TIB13109.1 hypothetical protein E3P93_02068 [Wallemia ichthyophaga]TIB13190.1 hypothetical protein E3P92_02351 [Wallemia ichthyophaga]TIB22279.1 hypothetical protein E3P89_02173 [Wallemia ichthyophaga]